MINNVSFTIKQKEEKISGISLIRVTVESDRFVYSELFSSDSEKQIQQFIKKCLKHSFEQGPPKI